MKQCPQCSAEYDDNISFCPKDGKSLVVKDTTRKQLCPYCANSIEEDATSCPYCKADLLSQFVLNGSSVTNHHRNQGLPWSVGNSQYREILSGLPSCSSQGWRLFLSGGAYNAPSYCSCRRTT